MQLVVLLLLLFSFHLTPSVTEQHTGQWNVRWRNSDRSVAHDRCQSRSRTQSGIRGGLACHNFFCVFCALFFGLEGCMSDVGASLLFVCAFFFLFPFLLTFDEQITCRVVLCGGMWTEKRR